LKSHPERGVGDSVQIRIVVPEFLMFSSTPISATHWSHPLDSAVHKLTLGYLAAHRELLRLQRRRMMDQFRAAPSDNDKTSADFSFGIFTRQIERFDFVITMLENEGSEFQGEQRLQ
jgi:hypothetical protein